MIRRAAPILAAAALAVAGLSLAGGKVLYKNKGSDHEFMTREAECDFCHVVEWRGKVGDLEEEQFSVFFVDLCVSCHPENLRRSHPVNIDPFLTVKKERYPSELPLQTQEDGGEELMTCVTCHKPHSERLKEQKLHVRQKPFPGSEGLYLTYYLRLADHDPEVGYMQLCQSCHPDM